MKSLNITIEACVDSVYSAIQAIEGGADRVELCSALSEGGLTPSFGTISRARKLLSKGLFVIIRPRGGDFLYNDDEFQTMKEDILQCRKLGVEGIVTGILLPDGNVDIERMKVLIKNAGSMEVTFHRAFDRCSDPFGAIDALASIGVKRILTSGSKQTAYEGTNQLKKFVDYAGKRIIVMPGSGIRAHNITEIRKLTGATEFHVSGKKKVESRMQYRNPEMTMSNSPKPDEFSKEETDEKLIKEIVEASRKL